jgi:hypothetical protein
MADKESPMLEFVLAPEALAGDCGTSLGDVIARALQPFTPSDSPDTYALTECVLGLAGKHLLAHSGNDGERLAAMIAALSDIAISDDDLAGFHLGPPLPPGATLSQH